MIWIKIKYRFYLSLNTFLFKIGFANYLLKNKYGERIIVFHGIDIDGETKYNSRFHSVEFFEKFIQYAKKNYNIISLDDFYKKKFKANILNIAITFDDGYLNNFKYAVPVLEKYEIPATFFITTTSGNSKYLWTDFIDLTSFYSKKKSIIFEDEVYIKNNKKEFVCLGISLKNKCKQLPYSKIESLFKIFEEEWKEIKEKPLDDYWKLMSTDNLKSILKNPLFSIGSHGLTHANLVAISPELAKNEIVKSKENLEQKLQIPITDFAFPFGTYNQELVDFCKELDYEKILLLEYNTKEKKHTLEVKERFGMNPYISMEQQIYFLLKGKYF